MANKANTKFLTPNELFVQAKERYDEKSKDCVYSEKFLCALMAEWMDMYVAHKFHRTLNSESRLSKDVIHTNLGIKIPLYRLERDTAQKLLNTGYKIIGNIIKPYVTLIIPTKY